MDKAKSKVFDAFKKNNPMAQFLTVQTLSRVDTFISTGSLALNAICSGKLENGGIPKGRVTVVAGESMTGKTYFSANIIRNAQELGMSAVIVDPENAYEPAAMKKLGINTDTALHVPVFSLEKCRNQIFSFGESVRENKAGGDFIVVIDSISMLESEQMLGRMEKDNTSVDMGSKPRAVKSLVHTCNAIAAEHGITFVIIAHIYDNPGEMFPQLEKVMPGGKSLKYIPSLVLQLARRPIKENDDKVKEAGDSKLTAGQKSYPGVLLRALTTKNRFIKQYLEAQAYLSFETGLHPYFGLLDLLKEFNVVTMEGRSYVITDTKENLGNYNNWHRNKAVWDKLLPLLQLKLDAHWPYGTDAGVAEEIPGDED